MNWDNYQKKKKKESGQTRNIYCDLCILLNPLVYFMIYNAVHHYLSVRQKFLV